MAVYRSWINENKELLLQYKGNWIAYTYENGLLAFGKTLREVIEQAEKTTPDFIIWHVHQHFGQPRVLPIKMAKNSVYTIRDESHYWVPEHQVVLQVGQKKLIQSMLVDSGSDFTIIPYETGQELGFTALAEELRHKAYDVNGSFIFLEREITCTINSKKFTLPVGWLQELKTNDFILGREIVFNLFDVEFRQADEVVVFKSRSDNS